MLRLLRVLALVLPAVWLATTSAWAADSKTVALRSGNEITVPYEDEVVLDDETLAEITTASEGRPNPSVEAVWMAATGPVFFEFENIGYVTMDDWAEIDVEELWQSYVEGTRAQSEDFGFEVKPIDWVIRPTLLRDEAVAYYALALQFGDDEPVVNLVIYDLGRHGYEEMTFVQDLADFDVARAEQIALDFAVAHDFREGTRYADFADGDMVAAVGIGALVAASLGSNSGKGFIAAVIAFFAAAGKKLLVLLLVPVYFVWNLIKRAYGSKDD